MKIGYLLKKQVVDLREHRYGGGTEVPPLGGHRISRSSNLKNIVINAIIDDIAVKQKEKDGQHCHSQSIGPDQGTPAPPGGASWQLFFEFKPLETGILSTFGVRGSRKIPGIFNEPTHRYDHLTNDVANNILQCKHCKLLKRGRRFIGKLTTKTIKMLQGSILMVHAGDK